MYDHFKLHVHCECAEVEADPQHKLCHAPRATNCENKLDCKGSYCQLEKIVSGSRIKKMVEKDKMLLIDEPLISPKIVTDECAHCMQQNETKV